ncbi:DNA polymerase I [Bulleidia sp. zg-1006]|uniref:DNA polymerase I n=1 Tax=Bulleidia sp. zg-1006 TaxID=2806552 RepID=UPI00193A435F|nr:DNA polymerase I [Bulleidia sp. zg-1006]QRG87160.1 DNA polymerase I [Bulleidia sp. zg-1006]
MKTLLLVDGNSMLFRGYYATIYGQSMSTSSGLPTNAVFAFATMLQKAMEQIQPNAVLVAFDAGKHTFRHELYPDYKAGRKQTPEDLVPQFQMVRDYLDAFGIQWVEMMDIEADDLVGSTAKQNNLFKSVILSSDKDLLQLVDDQTTVMLMKKGITEMEEMTPDSVKEIMGVTPSQIIDLKGLMGDSSDNIPGIAGVGQKTAVKLLEKYGSVEEVLAHRNELKGALQKKVIEGEASALLSKKLATIKTDVELPYVISDLDFKPTYHKLVQFLETLEMRQLVRHYSSIMDNESIIGKEEMSVKVVHQLPLGFFRQDLWLVVDEDQAIFNDAKVYGLAFANQQECLYISLKDYLKDASYPKVWNETNYRRTTYDIKRNSHLLERNGIHLNFSDDVMIYASLVESTITSFKKLKEKTDWQETLRYEDVYKKEKLIEKEQAAYCASLLQNFIRIDQDFYPKLEEMNLNDLYRKIELPLALILKNMEQEGIRCDEEVLNRIAEDTLAKIQELEKSIYEIAGHAFNLNSPKQLAVVLYDELAILRGKKRSTAAGELEKVQGLYPVIDDILAYRKYSKLYSTYAEGLKKYIQADGKIHTVYNQAATQTGRLSSSEPNLQNISIRDEEGKEIRKAFLAQENCVLISSDYHQVELRILAHMAKVPNLIKAFQNNIDIHSQTAMDLFDCSLEEVTPIQRRQAKTVNFGIVYGISDFGLATQLGVSRFEARDFIEKYYRVYPEIKSYMDGLIHFCKEKGYVETLCHRRREIPEIHDKNKQIQAFGERAAMNAPIQGTAADLIKLAMIQLCKMMDEKQLKSKMILQVHDELIFNVPRQEIEEMKKIIQKGMEEAMHLDVPLTSEISIGQTWYEAK